MKKIAILLSLLISSAAQATVPSETSSFSYTCDGLDPTYDYPFKILYGTDLIVKSGATTLTYLVDYTLSGVGQSAGGVVTLTSAGLCPAATTLALTRYVTLIQSMSLRTQGVFSMGALENAYDKQTMMSQQIVREQDARDDAQDVAIELSGSLGGSAGQMQYNAAGTDLGGITTYLSDGTDVEILAGLTSPTVPSATQRVKPAARALSASGPVVPVWMDLVSQIPQHVMPFLGVNEAAWGCLLPGGHATNYWVGSGAQGVVGQNTLEVTSPASHPGWFNSSIQGRSRRVRYTSGATGTSSTGIRSQDVLMAGEGSYGGFVIRMGFSIVSINATQRSFFGVKTSTAEIGTAVEPDTVNDSAYFGCNASHTTLRFCTNDETTTATCTDLGANFPCKTANQTYTATIWSPPAGTSMGYHIKNMGTGNETTGSVASDLPLSQNGPLGWDVWMNAGGTAQAVTLEAHGVCWVSLP